METFTKKPNILEEIAYRDTWRQGADSFISMIYERLFFDGPVLPDNGFDGRNWRDDFQLTLHKQDEVHVTQPIGNIFLTNTHRVYAGDDIPPSPESAAIQYAR